MHETNVQILEMDTSPETARIPERMAKKPSDNKP